MITALIVAVLAMLVGLLFGGTFESLVTTKVRWLWLVYIGFIVQITALMWSPQWLEGGPEVVVLALTNVPIAIFMALNHRLPGMIIAAAGLALNLLVISANGAMPVATGAATGVNSEIEDSGVKHEWLDESTHFPWLADVIPVKPIGSVLSLGDILLAAGIGYFVFAQMTRSRYKGRHRMSKA
jgi:hypothetical protein